MSIDDVQLDVLDSGSEPDRRRRAAAAVVAAVLVIALVAGWFVDRRLRQGEYDAVAGCAQQSGSEYRSSTARLVGMAEYVRPSLTFATEPTARALYAMVAHQAVGISGGLEGIRARCAAVGVRGWHPDQRAALTAELRRQDAQLDLLARTRDDGLAYYQDSQQVSDARTAAATALAAARPALPW